MAMRRLTGIVLLILGTSIVAQAHHWLVGEPVYVYPVGTRPSVWNDTIAFQDGNGGPIMFHDGAVVTQIFYQSSSCWEPANAGTSVAWRYTQSGASSNEIYRWNGQTITNVSNSPGVIDSDLSAGGNGDLIWSQNHTWLMYYNAATGVTSNLGVRGVHPDLYITADGIATYAYQNPDTKAVHYFDGVQTHNLGPGNVNGACPSVWDGAVAWVGTGEVGGDFTKSEIFWWKNGQVVRVTNDTTVGIADEYPCVWRNIVVWNRGVNGIFSHRIFVWDGQSTTQVTFVNSKYPSVHHSRLAYVTDDALYYADLYPLGDLNYDRDVDLDDLAEILGHYGMSAGAVYEQGDLDGDGDIDLDDLAAMLGHYGIRPGD